MDFQLGQCSNCGHDSFLQIEDKEYPFLSLTPAKKLQDGSWKYATSIGMLVSAFTCANCREIKLFEIKNK